MTRDGNRICSPQRIIVFQQNGSGEGKIRGIQRFGGAAFTLSTWPIDLPLPPVIDDASDYLPKHLAADLVLDFLKHPDLSEDLATRCTDLGIPMVASGKKMRVPEVLTPPT